MELLSYEILERKVIFRIRHGVCETPDELLSNSLFKLILKKAVKELEKRQRNYLI